MSTNSVAMNVIRPSLLPEALKFALQDDVNQKVYVEGPPGGGKSSIIRQVVAGMGRELIDIRLSQMDSVDLLGVPFPSEGVTSWNPPEFFYKLSQNPEKYVLMMDEYDKAPIEVQNASLQILLDDQVGSLSLNGAKMVLAGNRIEDRANSNKISTAARNRVTTLTLDHNHDDTIKYWVQTGFAVEVIAFCRFSPTLLNEFVRRSDTKEETTRLLAVKDQQAFATPRSWEFVSRMIKASIPDSIMLPMICGTVGNLAGLHFTQYLKVIHECPDITTILNNPNNAPIPTSPGGKIAVATGIGAKVSKDTMEAATIYLDRMESEYGVMSLMDAYARDARLGLTKAAQQWVTKHKAILM